MMFPTNAASEAIFGSAARGDSDDISDRDLLIVDESSQVLSSRRQELEREGWSVAAYTFRRLEALSKKGALFIQHLKLESSITRDHGGRLATLLRSFEPKRSYQVEIAENANLARLIDTHPATACGPLWAADVLYVAVRNFGILSLAEHGIFKFSYSEIIDQLIDVGLIRSEKTRDYLRDLRLFKSAYRSKSTLSPPHVEAGLLLALQSLPKPLFPLSSWPTEPRKVISDSFSRPDDNAYCCLRRIEKGVVAATTLFPGIQSDSKFAQVARWIEDPRRYAFLSHLSSEAVFQRLRDIPEEGYVDRGQPIQVNPELLGLPA